MRPHFDPNVYGSNNKNLQYNGASVSAPHQVMGNQGNFCPNPVQIPRQFQAGILNNPQLAMLNPNPYFALTQNFPFPQGSFQSGANLPNMFAYNSVNQPQFFPNGLPNLVPNNQLLQMQMPMPNCGPKNYFPSVNSQLGMNNGNGVTRKRGEGNGFQHTNCSTPVNKDFVSPHAQLSQNLHSPDTANSQSSGKVNGMNGGKSSWRKSHNTNFMKDTQDASQQGFGKRQFQHGQRVHGNKFNNDFRGKGKQNNGMNNVNISSCREDTQVEKKRPPVVNYTEKEIQQWREERRKYYPSKANMEKKLKVKAAAQPEITDEATKIRREQLKEILAKQAELGCEVAEIPSSYLSDSEQQMHGWHQNNKAFGRGGRFQNKFNRRGKLHQNNRFSKRRRTESNHPASSRNQHESFSKKQRPANGLSFDVHRDKKREPSLLKKLLCSDIKRDKKHLLQVFRFMVMNSFVLDDEPDKSLKFPAVIIKESDEDSIKLDEEDQ